MNATFSVIDALYQVMFLAFIAVIIMLIVSLFRYIKRRRLQLDMMERMLEDLNKEIKKEV